MTRNQQVLHHRGNILVRRQRLAPGEATAWPRGRLAFRPASDVSRGSVRSAVMGSQYVSVRVLRE